MQFCYAKFKFIDGAHSSYASVDTETALAALDTIETPEKHLLTQDEVFDAEGGFGGLGVQLAGTTAGLVALQMYAPHTFTYIRNAQLKWAGFLAVGASSFIGYQLGHTLGVQLFGKPQALTNHWVAYHYVKTINRFEGQQILSKKHGY